LILVDTSVWVEHLRGGLPSLKASLEASEVVMHPWVVGELACGHLHQRAQLLDLLQGLPAATVASASEVLLLIEQEQLMGRGIGYVDAHLLASARLTGCWLWTEDRRLGALAKDLGVAAPDCRP